MLDPFSQGQKPLWKSGGDPARSRHRLVLSEFLSITAFVLFCVKYTFDYSELVTRPEILNSLLVGAILFLLIFKILIQRYTPIRFILTVTLCGLVGYSSLKSINYIFLIGFLFVLAMQDIDIKRIVRISFCIKVASIATQVAWYFAVYLINPSSLNFVYRGGAGSPRHYFYMGHANMFTAFLVWASIEYIFLHYSKINITRMAVIWAINMFFRIFTDSTSGILLLLIITVLISLDKLGNHFFDKTLTFFARFLYTICTIVFTFLVMVYAQLTGTLREIWEAIDSFYTGRLWYGAFTNDYLGPTLLGRNLRIPYKYYWHGRWADTFGTFDNYYIGNLYHYGIINLVVIGIVLILLCGKMENLEKIIIIMFAFYAISEVYVVNIYMCFPLMIVGKYLYPQTETVKIPGG